MSVFNYNSRHKAILAFGVVIAVAVQFYMNRPERPTFHNGQVKQTGGVVDGRNHGIWVWYHASGPKKMEGRFELGKRAGRWLTFSPDGDTLTESFYRDDRLNGTYTVFGPDGNPVMVSDYVDDRQVGPTRNLTE
ncbi:MAG: hypothetical protein K9J06_14635 [Flavobacteriales bacterium]|nr:hypothetical protein [Flavobacteriales bacterium]